MVQALAYIEIAVENGKYGIADIAAQLTAQKMPETGGRISFDFNTIAVEVFNVFNRQDMIRNCGK